MKNIRFKSWLILITYAILLYFVVLNISSLFGIFNRIVVILTPFLFGFIIAYLLNRPFVFFQEKLFSFLNNKQNKFRKLKVPLSIVTCYIVVFGLIGCFIYIVTPQLIASVNNLMKNFYQYISSLEDWILNIASIWNVDPFRVIIFKEKLIEFMQDFNQLITTIFPHLFNFTKSFTSGIYNWIIGIVISIYFLSNKEKLIEQLKITLSSLCPSKVFDKIYEVAKLTDYTFGRFIIGKLLDSIIVGILCFIGMTILRMPYAVLISVIVGVTNIIPFFGPFIGAIPSIFILLIVNPMKAIWFCIFILILQQLDGNVIGPKIIGNSIGISGIWILFSVIIGGGLFGFIGMVMGVPIFAIIYSMLGPIIRLKANVNDNSINLDDSSSID